MNRGSAGRIVCRSDPRFRFNEAPIHESGKFGRPTISDSSAPPLQ